MKNSIITSLVFIIIFAVCFTSCTFFKPNDEAFYELSEELELEILKVWLGDNVDFDNYWVNYYGTYSGYTAVTKGGKFTASWVNMSANVGGHYWHFPSDNVILLYKDGEFTDIYTAIKEGILTQTDIDRLHKTYVDAGNPEFEPEH